MSRRDCNGALKTFLGMSGTEDSSQDDLRDDYATDIWYLNNLLTITDIQIYSQIYNLGFWLQTEKVGFKQLQTTGGASETFQTWNKKKTKNEKENDLLDYFNI